jgi:hypothetical protein
MTSRVSGVVCHSSLYGHAASAVIARHCIHKPLDDLDVTFCLQGLHILVNEDVVYERRKETLGITQELQDIVNTIS